MTGTDQTGDTDSDNNTVFNTYHTNRPFHLLSGLHTAPFTFLHPTTFHTVCLQGPGRQLVPRQCRTEVSFTPNILTCTLGHAGVLVHHVVLKYKCFHSCFSIMAMLLFTPLLAFIPRLASIRAERTLIVPQTVRQVGGFSQYGCKLRNDDRRMSNLCTHDSELR